MSRLLDFNLNTPKKTQTSTCNESSIVINNNVNERKLPKEIYPSQITYGGTSGPNYPTINEFSTPSVGPTLETPLIAERSVDLIPPPTPDSSDLVAKDKLINELRSSVAFYQELAQTFSKILKNNNIDLLANIIDNSGKIILDAESLCNLIGLIVGAPVDIINLQYEEKEVSCLHKINPIHKLENIKVATLDFKLCYNNLYNILQDKYAVSLSRVLVKGRKHKF
jgi:hypothetical protein